MLELGSLYADFNILSACRFQLRLSLSYVDVRGYAAMISGFGKMQCILKVVNRRVQQLFLQVQPAKGEVVDRKLRVKAQTDILKIARARLCVLAGRLDGSPNLSPEVNLVGDISLQDNIAILTLSLWHEIRPVLRELGS